MPDTSTLNDPRAVRLGKRLRERRRALGLSQDQVAAAAGCSQAAVSKWEHGQQIPQLASLIGLRRALGADQDEFDRWIELVQ